MGPKVVLMVAIMVMDRSSPPEAIFYGYCKHVRKRFPYSTNITSCIRLGSKTTKAAKYHNSFLQVLTAFLTNHRA